MRIAKTLRPTRFVAIGALMLQTSIAVAQLGDLVGDPKQGEVLFRERLCYACHGFSGETGVPLRPLLPKEAFIVIVRTPPMRQMPAYSDLSPQQVAHIYAYLESLPSTTPSPDEVPLLNSIVDQARSASRGAD
ncbi:MAG: cytochrome c [Gammaproteobacteria bacterium]